MFSVEDIILVKWFLVEIASYIKEKKAKNQCLKYNNSENLAYAIIFTHLF